MINDGYPYLQWEVESNEEESPLEFGPPTWIPVLPDGGRDAKQQILIQGAGQTWVDLPDIPIHSSVAVQTYDGTRQLELQRIKDYRIHLTTPLLQDTLYLVEFALPNTASVFRETAKTHAFVSLSDGREGEWLDIAYQPLGGRDLLETGLDVNPFRNPDPPSMIVLAEPSFGQSSRIEVDTIPLLNADGRTTISVRFRVFSKTGSPEPNVPVYVAASLGTVDTDSTRTNPLGWGTIRYTTPAHGDEDVLLLQVESILRSIHIPLGNPLRTTLTKGGVHE